MTFLRDDLPYIFRVSTFRRHFIRSIQILRNEGIVVFWRRLCLKISGIQRLKSTKPKVQRYRIEENICPVRFTKCLEPIVSITIPIYNKHLYTYSCLKSIVENTIEPPYEVIVVDDCSDSKTSKMLRMVQNIRLLRNETNLGFIRSCNRGAKTARGQYLVILNNDTIVTPGWLQALLRTFKIYNNTGLVGCKLIYPDGRLQEAGGIIWKDGFAWNYGRSDDLDKPQYNYLREVDYCSGACLMIPRQLFYDVGLFDVRYAPAYYEDADLAFKVRKAGKKVLYQPRAVVVHFEGITSGKSLGRGVKRYQEINRNKFYQRWERVLMGHPDNGVNPEFAKEHRLDKRVLVLDARILTPDQDSGSYRMYNVLSIFQDLGYKVTFIPANLACQQPYVSDLQERGIEVLYTPYMKSVERYLRKRGRYFNIIMLSRADVADRFIDYVNEYAPDALVLFDTVDLHFIREQRMAEVKNSSSFRRLAKNRKKQELEIASKADITIVVSPVEKAIIQDCSPGIHVEVVSNIHEVYGAVTPFDKRDGILFIGGFEHPPNEDAMIYYVEEILPLIRQRLSGAKTYIIGSKITPRIKSLASHDIIVEGYIKDVSNYLNKCRVSIAPLRYGSGVKGKVNMSMSYGLPAVATPIAVEGTYLEDGHDVLIADDAQTFADRLVRLYQDKILWNKLSENGQRNVERYFSRQVATEALKNIVEFNPKVRRSE